MASIGAGLPSSQQDELLRALDRVQQETAMVVPDDVEVRAGAEAVGRRQLRRSRVAGEYGILHGSASLILQTEDGQIRTTHSVSAGLDYPGSGPEHAYLKETGRAEYVAVSDDDALSAFAWVTRTEGIIPALECAHAFAYLVKLSAELPKGSVVLVNLSGRGDKDVNHVAQLIYDRADATSETPQTSSPG